MLGQFVSLLTPCFGFGWWLALEYCTFTWKLETSGLSESSVYLICEIQLNLHCVFCVFVTFVMDVISLKQFEKLFLCPVFNFMIQLAISQTNNPLDLNAE